MKKEVQTCVTFVAILASSMLLQPSPSPFCPQITTLSHSVSRMHTEI
jgi:hypothetical protein